MALLALTHASSTHAHEATRALNAWIEVDLDAVIHNIHAIRRHIGPGPGIIAVVKANAYGHGVEGTFRALEEAGVSRLAVAWLAEAVALRKLGARLPLLVLGHAFPEDAALAVQQAITLTVHTRELVDALSAAARDRGATAKVHIKIDTGLHRFGVTPDGGIALANYARSCRGIEVEGLWTHMANADEEDDSFAETQHDVFARAVAALPWIPFRHIANSATALRRREFAFEGVRTGLAMWGILPENTPGLELRPALALKARVARVAAVGPGEGVSYGLTWRATAPSHVALIPVGYADGWRRALSPGGEVLVRGQRCPIAGRICMDQFLVDVTHVVDVAEGDEAVLIGSQEGETITATDIAARLGTIPWEVVAALQTRLPRVYHRSGLLEIARSKLATLRSPS